LFFGAYFHALYVIIYIYTIRNCLSNYGHPTFTRPLKQSQLLAFSNKFIVSLIKQTRRASDSDKKKLVLKKKKAQKILVSPLRNLQLKKVIDLSLFRYLHYSLFLFYLWFSRFLSPYLIFYFFTCFFIAFFLIFFFIWGVVLWDVKEEEFCFNINKFKYWFKFWHLTSCLIIHMI
jgi:hypothetical protein